MMSSPSISEIYICRRRFDRFDRTLIIRRAGGDEKGMSLTEAFREAKRAAGWHREIPNEEGK